MSVLLRSESHRLSFTRFALHFGQINLRVVDDDDLFAFDHVVLLAEVVVGLEDHE